MADHSFENVVATGSASMGLWVFIRDIGENTFIPYSQITDDSEVYEEGHEGRLCVTEWLAQERGWLKTGTPFKSDRRR